MVANTTFAFVAAALVWVIGLFALRDADLAAQMLGQSIPWFAFFVFLGVTWWRAPKHSDAAMTGDQFYVEAIRARFEGARNPELVRDDELPMLGTMPTEPNRQGAARE